MECFSGCKTLALINELKSEYPDGDIPAGRARPLWEKCVICSHGCTGTRKTQTSPGRKPCKTYMAKQEAEARVNAIQKEVFDLGQKAERRPDLYSFALGRKTDELSKAKSTLFELLKHCASCDWSTDNNLSRDGASFVSIDSEVRGSETAANSAERDNSNHKSDSLADYILSLRVIDRPPSCDFDELKTNDVHKSVTSTLPPEIENKLHRALLDFTCSLSLVDKLLVLVLMTRKPQGAINERYNLEDFAKLKWISCTDGQGRRHETDFARFLRACGWGPVEGAGRSGVSIQAVSQRFQRIIAKIPALAAVAHGQMNIPRGTQ